jgi:hypothetical protein
MSSRSEKLEQVFLDALNDSTLVVCDSQPTGHLLIDGRCELPVDKPISHGQHSLARSYRHWHSSSQSVVVFRLEGSSFPSHERDERSCIRLFVEELDPETGVRFRFVSRCKLWVYRDGSVHTEIFGRSYFENYTDLELFNCMMHVATVLGTTITYGEIAEERDDSNVIPFRRL